MTEKMPSNGQNHERKHAACGAFEARLEDHLAGLDSGADLVAHIGRCTACSEALESARLAGELLREGFTPIAAPHPAFAARVMAHIRAQERIAGRPGDLWGALEYLARRLALVAAMALVLLGVYVGVEGLPLSPEQTTAQAQADAAAGFPAMVGQPGSSDETLQTLADVTHAR